MLLETLAGRGDRMDVITFADGEDIAIENSRFFRVPALPGTRNVPPGFSLKKLISDVAMFPMVCWRLLRNRYDLVLAVEESAYMAMVLKPIFRVPYIFDIDSSIPEQIGDKYDLPRPMVRFLMAVERAAARRAIGAIVCCAALGELVHEYAPEAPIQVLEDVTMLEESPEVESPDAEQYDEPVVIYVGNLEPYQGLGLLLEGMARLDHAVTPVRLVIIGGAPHHIEDYRGRAAELGIADRVTFLGPKPVAELGKHLRTATITASPRTQGRNTPMKVYSYLDSGRPLIATRLPTHTQVLDDEIAMLVNPDPEDVARGLRALLSDPELRARIATAARARVAAEFTPAAYRRKLSEFLDAEILPRLKSARTES
jgi:glycosyltransferase involved in cell wall biosynthesis